MVKKQRKKSSIIVIIIIAALIVILAGMLHNFRLDERDVIHDHSSFPRTQESYNDQDMENVGDILKHRLTISKFNWLVTLIFFLAIAHTMMTSQLKKMANEAHHEYEVLKEEGKVDKNSESIKAGMLHLVSEVEVVFGIWTIALAILISSNRGWHTFIHYIDGLHYNEPLFIIVIMTIASSRPILKFFEGIMWKVVKVLGGNLQAWWMTILVLGPVLGSFITEPAAMTISAYILSEKFYNMGPSRRLKYGTLALLFVNISIGGALTNFAAPPILMVADPWKWDVSYMFFTFGWKAIIAILISTATYYFIFKNDLQDMEEAFKKYQYKVRIQKMVISQKELEANFDELSLLISKNTKFQTELKAYGFILKDRIKEMAARKLTDEEAEKYNIDVAIDEKFDSIQLREMQRVIPGLLDEKDRPIYYDPHWDKREDSVPVWIILVHILFLVWTVFNSHTPALFLGGFLFYLGFHQVTTFYQNRIDLKPALLVAFFLAGLVVHGTLQAWWIAPILANLPPTALNITAIVLTAFNDNAAITYLSTLVPDFSDTLKYALVSGAITGGGLTVIANAPNPVGQSILKKHFVKGISAVQLLKFALIPTIITAICFMVF